MRVAYRLIALFGVTCLVFGFLVHTKVTVWGAGVFGATRFALAAMALVTIFLGVLRWRKLTRLWMIPSVLCAALFWGSPAITTPLGAFVNDRQFKRQLGSYERVLSGLRSQTIWAGTTLTDIDASNINKAVPDVIGIKAARCDNGAVIAEFFQSGFRIRNGYLFKGYEESDPCVTESMRPESHYQLRHVIGNWYHFSQ
jgi:hypothetical protein